jgi:hypothetical protein
MSSTTCFLASKFADISLIPPCFNEKALDNQNGKRGHEYITLIKVSASVGLSLPTSYHPLS